MRQRLGIAHALLGNPSILILDEPANGLDPAGIHWMRELLSEYADRGGTVLLSSHLLNEVEIVADEIILIGALLQASSILQGLAFGLVILNSAGAIATFFILPTALGIVASLWKALAEVAPWIVLNTATGPLIEARTMTGEEWAHLGVASLIWIALPLLVGLFQVLRREVK